jgi:hypothetical protein
MAFSIIFCITVILFISFVSTKKNLHLFEIFFMWMIINIIHHNFLTVIAVNLHMFDFAEKPANYWALVFMRVFLIPLLIIWYFDQTLSVKPYKKWAWLPVGILILLGVEYLADFLNVYRHTRWKLWWSLIEWFVIFLLVNYSWIWWRNLLKKEMD